MTKWIFVLLAACGGGLGPAATETLTDSVRIYNDGVRWQRWDNAASYLPVKDRGKWVDDSDARAKDLKITEYDVVRIDPKGDREAKVQIKMSWYKTSEATVHETHSMQTWERHGKDWTLVDETRQRGDEMPGLPEPLMKDGDLGSGSGSGSGAIRAD
jgi:hypothetical protein